MNEKVFELLNQADWEHITFKLMDYAEKKIGKLYWHDERDKDSLPKGYTVEDIVNDAIEKVWNGERNWDPEKVPDLVFYLTGVVRSLINSLVESWEHEHVTRFKPKDDNDALEEPVINEKEVFNKTPEQIFIKKTVDEEIEGKVFDVIRGDDELETIILCISVNHAIKPAEIAGLTNIPVSRIYKLREKLQRLLDKNNIFINSEIR